MKFFLWEVMHKGISTSEIFEKRMPYMTLMTLFPSWCPLCKKGSEWQSHLFMQYTYDLLTKILNIFGWHLIFLREVKDLLDMVLTYHPFKNVKALRWKNLIMTFFWNWWKKRNKKIFVKKTLVQNSSTMLFNSHGHKQWFCASWATLYQGFIHSLSWAFHFS